MPQSTSATRSNNARQNRLADMDTMTTKRRSRRLQLYLPSVYLWGAVLFTLISILPLTWGVQPLPYYLGYVSKTDVISRTDFMWKESEEEEKLLREIENTYPNRYRQEAQGVWINKVSSPVWALIESASRANRPEQLVQAAKKHEIALTEEQAKTMIAELQNPDNRIDVFWDVVSPMQAVLRDLVFKRGLMDSDRYTVEQGKTIQIIDPERENRTTRVLRNDPLSPIEPSQLPALLNQGFTRMSSLSYEFRSLLRDILLPRLTPTLSFDEKGSAEELEELRRRVRMDAQKVEADKSVILAKGQIVTPAVMDKLRREDRLYRIEQGWSLMAQEIFSKMLLIFVISLGFLFFLGRYQSRNATGPRIATMACIAGALVLMSHAMIYSGLPATFVPVGLLAGATAFLMGVPIAMLAVTSVCLTMMVLFEGQVGAVMACLGAGWLLACLVPTTRYALGLLNSAAIAGLLASLIVAGSGLAANEQLNLDFLLSNPSTALTSGYVAGRTLAVFVVWILTGIVMMALLPVLETGFNLTTTVRLQALQNQNHPLLRQLVMEAPGSYHHSIIVGILAEAGAEAIGANALLAKVGSHYHDIGKLMKPEYFSENESGISRHDSLKPSMSALIIMAHVKDGSEMARAIGLPPGIIDIIEQHHGSGLISYFHYRAKKQADPGETISEQPFRYPGPKPHSREAAIVMLADSIEAATRSLSAPSPSHIEKLVHDLILQRLLDGQLEESSLTLTDLKRIEEAFFRVLTSMFHTRVKYPGQAEEKVRRIRKR